MSKRLPPFSADYLLHALQLLPSADSYLVGFSGGADSTALLHALASLKGQLDAPVRAVHINHGLHPQADKWQQHCEELARAWSVPFSSLTVHLEGNGKGLEAEARELRYAALQSLMTVGECLLTAHHADDQAETLLLNLFRGSGVDGLAAMPIQRPLGQHRLMRPLLGVTGQSLRDYLQKNDIEWLEDPSNDKIDQDRNFVRHKVLPLLETRFQGITQRLLLSCESMSETRSLLEPVADQYLQTELVHALVLNTSKTLLESPALFKLVIRRWLANAGIPAIPGRQLNDLYEQVSTAGTDQNIDIAWAECHVRAYQSRLFLQRGDQPPACAPCIWPQGQSSIKLHDGLGRLSFQSSNPVFPSGEITVTNRQEAPGLSLALPNHHQSIKNLFQSAKIPVWLRDSIPLILIDKQLAAVGDWSLSESFALWLTENNVKLNWQPEAPILQYIAGQQYKS